MTETTAYRRLYRSRSNRLLAGVCAGIARYFNTDPVAIRVAFAILVLFTGGVMLLAYPVTWVLMPEELEPANSAPVDPATAAQWPTSTPAA